MAKDIFWTDMRQASERLLHTVVLYDGLPFYIHSLLDGADFPDRDHRALLISCDSKKEETRKKLNSPKFKRFRALPELGWMNASGRIKGAILLSRRAHTTTKHGLTHQNTLVKFFRGKDDNGNPILRDGGDYNFSHFMYDEGFANQQKNLFPSLEATLNNIVEASSIAISKKFCVMRDAMGIRWLYKGTDCIGLFTGVDTLNLLTKFSFLREEIEGDEVFTINTIREF